MAKRTYTLAGGIADRIRTARADAGMTVLELAREAHVGKNTVDRISQGLIRNPGVGTIADLARDLGVHVAWLAYGVGLLKLIIIDRWRVQFLPRKPTKVAPGIATAWSGTSARMVG